MQHKDEAYKWIKITGFVSFIPFILVVGPLGGYFVGDFFCRRFGFNEYSILIFIALGFIASISETVKIIQRVTKILKNP